MSQKNPETVFWARVLVCGRSGRALVSLVFQYLLADRLTIHFHPQFRIRRRPSWTLRARAGHEPIGIGASDGVRRLVDFTFLRRTEIGAEGIGRFHLESPFGHLGQSKTPELGAGVDVVAEGRGHDDRGIQEASLEDVETHRLVQRDVFGDLADAHLQEFSNIASHRWNVSRKCRQDALHRRFGMSEALASYGVGRV